MWGLFTREEENLKGAEILTEERHSMVRKRGGILFWLLDQGVLRHGIGWIPLGVFPQCGTRQSSL